ncbi:MAG: LytTR family DNA-binding domain-containing protein [Flavobacteriaceae bacterium]|jgi:DNA-binding LytR/AlgR family response regulator|nr:LytTR family DNA-binding domain-containing protein [Flavobacteriaceae bacterium]
MKTIIIEDEKPAARKLERMLAVRGFEVEATLYSVKSSVEWLRKNPHPLLIFTDIQLEDGLSFSIFKTVPTRSFLIFTTAFDQYTLQAFKLNSIDYLLKPINNEELAFAIEKFKQIQQPTAEIPYQELLKGIFTQEKFYRTRFLIKVGNFLKPVYTKEISCFFSEEKITWLHIENRDLVIDATLDNLEEELDPKDFFRINRQYIIRADYIQEILSYSNSRLQISLKNHDEKLTVSRERVKDFKNWLER